MCVDERLALDWFARHYPTLVDDERNSNTSSGRSATAIRDRDWELLNRVCLLIRPDKSNLWFQRRRRGLRGSLCWPVESQLVRLCAGARTEALDWSHCEALVRASGGAWAPPHPHGFGGLGDLSDFSRDWTLISKAGQSCCSKRGGNVSVRSDGGFSQSFARKSGYWKCRTLRATLRARQGDSDFLHGELASLPLPGRNCSEAAYRLWLLRLLGDVELPLDAGEFR